MPSLRDSDPSRNVAALARLYDFRQTDAPMSATDTSATTEEVRLRPWPKGAAKPGAFRKFVAALREAFDSDPEARYCAAELDGVTVVVAVGRDAEKLQAFVRDGLYGVIELPPALLKDSDA